MDVSLAAAAAVSNVFEDLQQQSLKKRVFQAEFDVLDSMYQLMLSSDYKKSHVFGPFKPQNFSLSEKLIYYITQNPSTPKFYQKIIQSCKYFFAKNSILFIERLYFGEEKIEAVSKNEKILLNPNSNKLWVKYFLSVESFKNPKLASSIINKFYKLDIQELKLEGQILSFKDFMFLTSKVVDLQLKKVTVEYGNGTVAKIENLVEALPKIKRWNFELYAEYANLLTESFEELRKIEHFAKIDYLALGNVNGTFDLEGFFDYVKKNKHTMLSLSFANSISADYRLRIKAIWTEIKETQDRDYKIPSLFCRF